MGKFRHSIHEGFEQDNGVTEPEVEPDLGLGLTLTGKAGDTSNHQSPLLIDITRCNFEYITML